MEDSIIADLKDSYGLTCNQITPVTGGWLNQKRKVSTDKCELLVKQLGRAILSFALEGNRINIEKISAFLPGI